MKICLMHVLIDLAGMSSSGRLRWRTPLGVSCLKMARSDEIRRVHSCFFRLFSFGGSVEKLYCLLPSCDTSLKFHGEVKGGECHKSRDQGLAMVVRVFVAIRNFLGDS
jgi:hypothetical protein